MQQGSQFQLTSSLTANLLYGATFNIISGVAGALIIENGWNLLGPHLEGRGRAKLLLRAFLSSPQDIKVGWGGHMTMPRQEIPLHLLLRGQLQSPTHRLKVPLLLRLRERYFVRPMTTPLWPPPTCRKQWHLETCGEETMTLESSGRRTLDQADTLDGNNTSPALPGRFHCCSQRHLPSPSVQLRFLSH